MPIDTSILGKTRAIWMASTPRGHILHQLIDPLFHDFPPEIDETLWILVDKQPIDRSTFSGFRYIRIGLMAATMFLSPVGQVVTQPRRFAAVSVARRVAEERGEVVGENSVGRLQLEVWGGGMG